MDGAVVAYASWTATCHAVMLLGGNVRHLTAAAGGVALVAVAGLAALALRRRRCSEARAGAEAEASSQAAAVHVHRSAAPLDRRTTIALAVLAAAAVGARFVVAEPVVFWLIVVLYLAVAAGLSLRSDPGPFEQARPVRWQEALLWIASLGSAFLALYAHRWRNDDCYYVNLAVTMVDRPDAPLLSLNTIHAVIPGLADSNAVFPPYRVHSFEALGGFVSYLTGVDAIRVMHLGLGTAAALFVPLAFARLFGLLDPQRWLFMVGAALCIQLFDGTAGLGFANQGIVRMFTGKSVLLTVALPVLVRHGVAFAARPSRGAFALLLAAQVCAVGLSSTALWLAPVVAMLAVTVPLRLRRAALRPLLLGLLSCTYVLALALWVRAQVMPGGGGGEDDASAALAVAEAPFRLRVGLVQYWMRLTFDTPWVAHAYMGLPLIAIPLARTALARRCLVAFTLVLAALFLNPFLADFIRLNVTGRFTGQRVLWLAPLPLALAVVSSCAIPAAGKRWRRALGVALGVAVLAAFFIVVPTRTVFSRENDVALRWPPQPKVPRAAFGVAQRVSELVPEGSQVLAPEVVSWYLPTIHRHAYPVLANAKYLRAADDEENRREELVEQVDEFDDDFSDEERARFVAELARYRVAAVVLRQRAAKTHGMKSTLKSAGYRRIKSGTRSYQLWIRRDLPVRGGVAQRVERGIAERRP